MSDSLLTLYVRMVSSVVVVCVVVMMVLGIATIVPRNLLRNLKGKRDAVSSKCAICYAVLCSPLRTLRVRLRSCFRGW